MLLFNIGIAAPSDGAIIKGTVGIGTTQPDTNAILDISSSTKGLLLPRLTHAQRMAISNPTNGMILYDSDSSMIYLYHSNTWNYVPLSTPPNAISGASAWYLTGNSGTNPSANFIGTTDNEALVFKVNNVLSGKIDQNLNNVALGYQCTQSITTATNCTFIGYQAGYANTSGVSNTGIGSIALVANITGSNNTAVGMGALGSNTTGSNNTSVGAGSLRKNTIAAGNTAFGTSALASDTTGNNNSAIGAYSLQGNITGSNNTALGYYTLNVNTSGSYNTVMGTNSMIANTTGTYNSSLGYGALLNGTTGARNVAIGDSAGATNTTGSTNTFIGTDADAASAALSNATAIGYNAKVGESNALILGGTGSYAVNVGIGTATPGNFLEINSGTGGVSGLRLKELPSGAVLFMSNTADVTQNNNNFYFDATNYRLSVAAGTSPNSTIQIGGSLATGISTKTSGYTAGTQDHTILCNTSAGPFNISLPNPSGATGRIYAIKKISSDANAVTLVTYYGSSTIDGQSTYTLANQYNSVIITTDGTSWFVIGKN